MATLGGSKMFRLYHSTVRGWCGPCLHRHLSSSARSVRCLADLQLSKEKTLRVMQRLNNATPEELQQLPMVNRHLAMTLDEHKQKFGRITMRLPWSKVGKIDVESMKDLCIMLSERENVLQPDEEVNPYEIDKNKLEDFYKVKTSSLNDNTKEHTHKNETTVTSSAQQKETTQSVQQKETTQSVQQKQTTQSAQQKETASPSTRQKETPSKVSQDSQRFDFQPQTEVREFKADQLDRSFEFQEDDKFISYNNAQVEQEFKVPPQTEVRQFTPNVQNTSCANGNAEDTDAVMEYSLLKGTIVPSIETTKLPRSIVSVSIETSCMAWCCMDSDLRVHSWELRPILSTQEGKHYNFQQIYEEFVTLYSGMPLLDGEDSLYVMEDSGARVPLYKGRHEAVFCTIVAERLANKQSNFSNHVYQLNPSVVTKLFGLNIGGQRVSCHATLLDIKKERCEPAEGILIPEHLYAEWYKLRRYDQYIAGNALLTGLAFYNKLKLSGKQQKQPPRKKAAQS